MAQNARKASATEPMTVGMLASAVGIDTQRLYSMVRRGDIRSQRLTGRRVVIPPDEANRVLAGVTHVQTKSGRRVYFDLNKVEDRI